MSQNLDKLSEIFLKKCLYQQVGFYSVFYTKLHKFIHQNISYSLFLNESVFDFFQDMFFHIDELIVYILLYAWLTMAKISTNPFDGDKHYDIDVIERIDTELFEATMAIHI